MKKSKILFPIIILASQGFFACKSDDIPPKSPPQKVIEQTRGLIETNHWQELIKPMDKSNIIFLNNVAKASQFFGKMRKS